MSVEIPAGAEEQREDAPPVPSSPLEVRVAELEREVEQLRLALESRTTIGTAIGLLTERYGSTSTQAWALLTRVSSVTNTRVRDLARVLVADADGETPDHADAATLARAARHLPAPPTPPRSASRGAAR